MKFIQDIDGNFVRVDKIIALKVFKLQKWTVCAYCENEHCSRLKTCDTEAEARSWLKEFVIQIDDELSGRNLTRNIFNSVTQLIKENRRAY